MPHQAHLQQDKTLRTKQPGMMSFYRHNYWNYCDRTITEAINIQDFTELTSSMKQSTLDNLLVKLLEDLSGLRLFLALV